MQSGFDLSKGAKGRGEESAGGSPARARLGREGERVGRGQSTRTSVSTGVVSTWKGSEALVALMLWATRPRFCLWDLAPGHAAHPTLGVLPCGDHSCPRPLSMTSA